MRYLITGALCALALPALADSWTCKMTSECLDQEPCADTDYDVSLDALEGGFLLSDIAGERPMTEVAVLDTPDQRAFVSKVQSMSVGLISLYPDGRAQYTVHSADYSVRYSGKCEASE